MKLKSPYDRSRTIELVENEKDEKYPFLTPFEKEEATRYEIFFIGSRRIKGTKDFTNSSCEARVATGDSVAYRYEVVNGLGHGSFGQVFKAFDHKKKEMVALKIIRNEPKFNRQAKIEIRIL
jgi:dual specificity tyrosine-phosphorylation-regulated kinase 2/3/4